MSRTIRLLESAVIEAAEAAAWYEGQQPGLGSQFQEALESALDLIEERIVPLVPVPGEPGRAGLSRLVLRRFPFSVIVRESENETVVVAFAHHARRPGYWKDRLRT